MIQAIETEYAGRKFRSRLEARWAVFFDCLGIKWDYEAEAFETSMGNYLPDFRIHVPGDGYPYWFEVKPDDAGIDQRHRALAVETATPLIVARGRPRSYRDQLRGGASNLAVILWGDRLDGAKFPAGDAQPEVLPCAFIGRERGIVIDYPACDEKGWTGRTTGQFAPYTRWPGHWDSIHGARHWYADAFDDVHVALFASDGGHPPIDCPDVDRAYAAANSARFGT